MIGGVIGPAFELLIEPLKDVRCPQRLPFLRRFYAAAGPHRKIDPVHEQILDLFSLQTPLMSGQRGRQVLMFQLPADGVLSAAKLDAAMAML